MQLNERLWSSGVYVIHQRLSANVNVIASVANGHTLEDRLEGMNFQIGDWHAGVKILSVSFEDIYRKFSLFLGFVFTALKLDLFPLKSNHH